MNTKIIAIIVIALLIIGGLYMWNQKTSGDAAAALLATEEQDTIEKIQANYAQIDVTALDAGMADIEAELQ